MTKCTFCNREIPKGTGYILAQNDGRILYFDNKKCEKNMLKLHRDPTKVNWIRKADYNKTKLNTKKQ